MIVNRKAPGRKYSVGLIHPVYTPTESELQQKYAASRARLWYSRQNPLRPVRQP